MASRPNRDCLLSVPIIHLMKEHVRINNFFPPLKFVFLCNVGIMFDMKSIN